MESTQDKIIKLICEMNDNGLRIGQIMSNVFYSVSENGSDPFYLEDNELLSYLEKYAEN